MGYYEKLSSAIYNDVVSGLRGYSSNPTMSIEQLEDDIIDERLQIIKEYTLRGIVPMKDLLMSINCIPVDCKSIDKCRCERSACETITAHFEIPQVLGDYGKAWIEYLGSTDKNLSFIVYTNPVIKNYHKYRKRGKNKPYVWIDMTPNENNMFDAYIFNAPLIESVSIVAVFKDPRQLDDYGCCPITDVNNMTFIDAEIKKRLTEKKLRYYRQLAAPIEPNDQVPK
jgi:hypothetical protein|nr:MAG TPA: Structural protein [Caudoviricetes sp.]